MDEGDGIVRLAAPDPQAVRVALTSLHAGQPPSTGHGFVEHVRGGLPIGRSVILDEYIVVPEALFRYLRDCVMAIARDYAEEK